MKRIRRRTVLGAIGATSVGSLGLYELGARIAPGGDAASDRAIDDLLTVADAVHPADPGPFRSVLESYVRGLGEARTTELGRTLSELNDVSFSRFGSPLRALSSAEARRLFAVLGVDRVQSKPNGTLSERTRYHVVNAVLYALMTNPEGTEVFGIGNPEGYAGGYDSNAGSLEGP